MSIDVADALVQRHVSKDQPPTLSPFTRYAQILDPPANVLANHLPIEGGVVLAEILRGFITKHLVRAVLLELMKKSRKFPQVVGVGELTDQVCGSNQTGVVPSER